VGAAAKAGVLVLLNSMQARERAAWPMRDAIFESWRRVVSSGLQPDHFDPPYDPDLDAGDRLERVAKPVIDQLADDLAGSNISLVVTDEQAHVVMRRVSDRSLAHRLDRISLAPGFSYREDHAGTNAIGTALEAREATLVQAEEHYADALTGMACAAVPITDPRNGAVLGIVDLTSYAEDANPLMLPFAKRAAWEIEQCLLPGASEVERVLHGEFLRARRHAKHPLVLVSEYTMRANTAAARVVDSTDQLPLWEWARRAFRTGGSAPSELRLANGTRAMAQCEPICDGGEVIGAVIHFGRAPSPAGPGASGADRFSSPSTAGWSSLTETEHSIALLIAQGLTNREAGVRLFVSRYTIDSHLRHIFRKLDVTSRVELTRLVVERGEGDL
jgi:transcriptional regulator of acetoin/glycerol metabolism/DNA-binding CsgD family transcriptional regulator